MKNTGKEKIITIVTSLVIGMVVWGAVVYWVNMSKWWDTTRWGQNSENTRWAWAQGRGNANIEDMTDEQRSALEERRAAGGWNWWRNEWAWNRGTRNTENVTTPDQENEWAAQTPNTQNIQ